MPDTVTTKLDKLITQIKILDNYNAVAKQVGGSTVDSLPGIDR